MWLGRGSEKEKTPNMDKCDEPTDRPTDQPTKKEHMTKNKDSDLVFYRLCSRTDKNDLITTMASQKWRSYGYRQKALELPADIAALLVKDEDSQADPAPDVGGAEKQIVSR